MFGSISGLSSLFHGVSGTKAENGVLRKRYLSTVHTASFSAEGSLFVVGQHVVYALSIIGQVISLLYRHRAPGG